MDTANESTPNQTNESNVSRETIPQQTETNEINQAETESVNTESNHSEESNEQTNENDGQQEQSPEWFMKDKYSSIEEQARSAFELQKKMGKYWGTPKDNYTLDGIEGVDKNDPLVEHLVPALKDLGLSQEGFSHLVKQYQDATINMAKKFEAELKKELTTNDAQTYQAIEKWMGENLTPEEKTLVQNNWLMTPADFKLFNSLRLMAAPRTNVPSSNQPDTVRFESSRAVENDKIKYRKEVNQKLRVPDKNYENELAQRYKDARSRELREEKLAR